MANFCTKCGAQLPDGAQFCTNCGAQTAPAYQQPQQTYQQPQQAYQQPQQVYQQPQQVYQQPYQQPYQPQEPPKSSAIAICAFIFAFIFAPVGLILGIVGLAKKNAGSKGLSVAAVVISGVVTLIGVVSVAMLMPPLLGYVDKAKQAAADTVAKRIKTEVTSVLTEADTKGYGMKNGRMQEFDITVSGGKWKLTAADPSNFETGNTVRWGEEVSGAYTDLILKELDTGEELLLANIAGSNPEVIKGSIHFAVYGNVCTACVFTSDTENTLSEGKDYPEIGDSGEFGNVSGWKRPKTSRVIGYAPAIGK